MYVLRIRRYLKVNSSMSIAHHKREIHFGTRVHMHPVCFSKFKKYENISRKSEKNWTQTYASKEHSWKFRQKITKFLLCAKKTNFWQKTFEKLLFSVDFFYECPLLAYVCVQFFSDFFEIFSYFLNFEKHTGYICTRVPKWISFFCSYCLHGKTVFLCMFYLFPDWIRPVSNPNL